jgi:hypothetical protein
MSRFCFGLRCAHIRVLSHSLCFKTSRGLFSREGLLEFAANREMWQGVQIKARVYRERVLMLMPNALALEPVSWSL